MGLVWEITTLLISINLFSILFVHKSRCSFAGIAPLEAILFDIDGTLCDSDPIHYFAFREMLQEVEFPYFASCNNFYVSAFRLGVDVSWHGMEWMVFRLGTIMVSPSQRNFLWRISVVGIMMTLPTFCSQIGIMRKQWSSWMIRKPCFEGIVYAHWN